MSGAARARAETMESHPLTYPVGPRDGDAAPIDRVVALFSGAASAGPAAEAEADDWSASLTAVRGVAARVPRPAGERPRVRPGGAAFGARGRDGTPRRGGPGPPR